jgi:hypothetical protein
MFVSQSKRSNVTVDDRRAVFVAGRARKASDIVAQPHEAFARNMLKSRLGWPNRDPAPESVKVAAKELGAALSAAFKKQLDEAAAKTEANKVLEKAKARLDIKNVVNVGEEVPA